MSIIDGYSILFEIESQVSKKLEGLRQDKKIGKSIEAIAIIEFHGGVESLPIETSSLLLDERVLTTWCRVSDVLVNIMGPKLDPTAPLAYDIYVFPASTQLGYTQCMRCWKYIRNVDIRMDGENPLCVRCLDAITHIAQR